MWELVWEGKFGADGNAGPTLLRLASVIQRIADGEGPIEGLWGRQFGLVNCVTHAKNLLVCHLHIKFFMAAEYTLSLSSKLQ
jgi:hypothetical protein